MGNLILARHRLYYLSIVAYYPVFKEEVRLRLTTSLRCDVKNNFRKLVLQWCYPERSVRRESRRRGVHNSFTPQAQYNTLECPQPRTGQHIQEPSPLQHPERASPRQATSLWHLHLPPASVRDHLQGGEPSEWDKACVDCGHVFPAKKWRRGMERGGKWYA